MKTNETKSTSRQFRKLRTLPNGDLEVADIWPTGWQILVMSKKQFERATGERQ